MMQRQRWSVSCPSEKERNRISLILPKGTGLDFNLEGMEEELTCPICLELYADPLMLPCSHSVCKKCLLDIMDSKAHKSTPDGLLVCPSCRKAVEASKEKISDLPKNLALENIVIRYTEERSKSIRKSLSLESPVSDLLVSPITDPSELPEFPSASQTDCELCDSSSPQKAAWYCVQCKVSYCHACFGKYHPRRGSLARHKVRPPADLAEEDRPIFCKDHEKETATMFCEKCALLVCHLCVCEGEGQHVGHTVLAPDTAHSKIKENIQDIQTKAEGLLATLGEQKTKISTLKEEMTAFHEEACHRIEQQYQRLLADITAALQLEKSRVLANMDAARSKSIKNMDHYSNENCRCKKRLGDLTQLCSNLSAEKGVFSLLQRASEAQPLSVQYDKFQQETDSATRKFEAVSKDKTSHVELQSGVEQFRNSASRILNTLLVEDAESYESIVPVVRSPTWQGRVDVQPRVQSKCLTTFGFTCSSFTAEALRSNCCWTVVVERNSGHWGSINTGYLFGVGIASQPVNPKDQVGMGANSWGLVCSGGHLALSHAGRSEQLMSVGSLPVSVMISVTQDHPEYVVLSYKLSHTTEGTSLSGKTVILDKALRNTVHPVFTVSQRVKMLFPTCV